MLSLLVSGVAHCTVLPFDVPSGFQVNDVEGEAAIPVDVLSSEEEPSASPAAMDKGSPAGEVTDPAGASGRADAASSSDAAVDAAVDDAPADAENDARADAAVDGGAGDGSAVRAADAATSNATGPRDPQSIIGAAGEVQADVVLVMLVVNAEVIRGHPVGARMGYLLRGIPQWDDFMSGTEIDPVRDTDWVMISGPSLVNTSRDVVLVHYSARDSVVDHAVDVVSRKYGHGGKMDVGVPGVRASLAHADRAERVILRPQSHVLAVVPPSIATKIARQLVAAGVPAHVRPGEAMYLRLVNPHHPMPEIPDSIAELRMRVVPRADGSADVFVDGDAPDADAATQAADAVKRMIRRHDDTLTSIVTHGVLDHVEVTTAGKVVKVHLMATREQIETLVTLVGDFLGVQAPQPLQPAH